MSVRSSVRAAMSPVVGVARKVDRKVFRRTVHLVREVGELRAEVAGLRAALATLMEQMNEIAVDVQQGRSETRASYIALRTLLDDSESSGNGPLS